MEPALPATPQEVRDEYMRTLQDLTRNSISLICVLSDVAEENVNHAACIVECIEEQLHNVSGSFKLPILHLIDSIIKRESTKPYYLPLLVGRICTFFTDAYRSGDQCTRGRLEKLRFTWDGLLPPETLTALDNAVRSINPYWGQALPAAHVNPKSLRAEVTAQTGAIRDPRLRKRNALASTSRESPENPTVFAPVMPKWSGPSLKPETVAANQSSSVAPAPPTGRVEGTSRTAIEEEESRKRKAPSGERGKSPSPAKRHQLTHASATKVRLPGPKRKLTTTFDDVSENPPKRRAAESSSKERPESVVQILTNSQNAEIQRSPQCPTEKLISQHRRGQETLGKSPIVNSSNSKSPPQPILPLFMVPGMMFGLPSTSTSTPQPMIPPFMVPGMMFGFPSMSTSTSTSTNTSPSTPQPPILVPDASVDVLDVIDCDPFSTMSIDGIPREIRHYVSTSVVLMNWYDAREILFSSDDSPRRIVVDDKFNIECMLNGPDVERMVYGKLHKFCLGTPTRELYVDGIGYKCVFGESFNVNLGLDARTCSVRLEGGSPKVSIGYQRPDLIRGKVDLSVNEEQFQLFVDSKAQKIEVEGCKFVFQFIDCFQRVLINDVPFSANLEEQQFTHHDRSFRFRLSPPTPDPVQSHETMTSNVPKPTALPSSFGHTFREECPPLPVSAATGPNTVSVVEDKKPVTDSSDVDQLLQKMIDGGLLPLLGIPSTTSAEENSPAESSDKSASEIDREFIEDKKIFKLKKPGLVTLLHTGKQCHTCGSRFLEKYDDHLDWHFRLNRRRKDGSRTIHSRKWYYTATSSLGLQGMGDEDDKGQNWFDKQPAECTEEIIEEVPCVKASPDLPEMCELCHDKFDQCFNQDLEEWQMRNAVLKDNKVYHPTCLEGHKGEDDDVEEIVDTTEPISLTEDEPSVTEADANVILAGSDVCLPTICSIKREKEDKSADTPASANQPTEKTEDVEPPREAYGQSSGTNKDDDDSDIEEVLLVEQPIAEIIISDDGNDLEDSHLETLHVEEIITAPEFEGRSDTIPEPVADDPADRIVDITQNESVVFIDGNVEPGSAMSTAVWKPTVIKLNIAKGKSNSPARSSPKNDETIKTRGVDRSRTMCEEEEPLPTGEEAPIRNISSAPASVKPRIRGQELTVYPTPVKTRSVESSLCAVM